MNVLAIHNRYREPGGEDRVFDLETSLLERHGHRVIRYVLDNGAISAMNALTVAARTVWSIPAYRHVTRLIGTHRVDLVHVHNTLPLASPSVHHAASAAGVPVVQTLHNYRLLCPNGVLVRGERPCVSCVGAIPVAAVRHACYRNSRAASAAVSGMLLIHRAMGTWERHVAAYIAPTEFVRRMFVAGGWTSDRIHVKPHFVDPDPGVGAGRGGYALYAGRLSPEKGLTTLLEGWARLRAKVPLIIAGDGPMRPAVEAAAKRLNTITFLGRQDRVRVQELMAECALLVFPSIFYETFGQVVIEAFATGTPVLTTAGGAAAELISPGRTGALVRPGDADDLACTIERLFADSATLADMRSPARAAFEAQFTAAANYTRLMEIYRAASAQNVTTAQDVSPLLAPFSDEAAR
jgi:glycosyltransferase involved in cell wall biosynthesis